MLMQFFHHEMDYIYFLYGYAFIVLAAICVVLGHGQKDWLPWKWLAIFGLIHGANEWLEMVTVSLGHQNMLHAIRFAALSASYIALLEFGRRGCMVLAGRKLSPWSYIPLLLLAAGGGLSGPQGIHASARYALGVPACVLACLVFLRAAVTQRPHLRSLLFTGFIAGLYGLATGVVPPDAAFFPASLVNQTTFFALTGVPVQIIRGTLAVLMAAGIWVFQRRYRRDAFATVRHECRTRAGEVLAVCLIAVLALGWVLTGLVGDYADSNLREDIAARARIAAASIDDVRVRRLAGSRADLEDPDYIRLCRQLEEMQKSSKGIRWLYILGQRDGHIVVLADSTPTGRPGHALPGVRYQKPPEQLYAAFRAGKDSAVGPYTDEWGTFVSGFAPITDIATGAAPAVLRIDMDASRWAHAIAVFRLAAITAVFVVASLLVLFAVIQQRMWESSQRIAISEHRLKEAQSIAHVGSWAYEAASGRIAYSDEVLRIFGYDPAERSAPIDELKGSLAGETRERLGQLVSRAVTEGGPFVVEASLKRRDGTVRDAICTARAVRSHEGHVTQLVGTLQDITERKQMEESLRTSESLLSHAMDLAGLGHWEYDAATDLFRLNDRFYSMLATTVEREGGYLMSPAALTSAFVHLEDAHSISEEISRATAPTSSGYSQQLELRVVRRDGQSRVWLVQLRTVTDADSKPIGMRGTCQDITEQKKADNALRESERRLSDIMEFYPDATMVVDSSGRIITWNRAMEQLTGFKAQDMLGKGDFEAGVPFYGERRPTLVDLAMHPDSDMLSSFTNLRWQGETLSGELHVPRLRGAKAYLFASATVLRNLRGEVVAAVESVRDITERRRMEESLRVSESQLSDAMELARQAYWEYDMATQTFSFNNRFYTLYGTTAEQEGGYHMPLEIYIREFIPEADAHIISDELAKAQASTASGYFSQFEHRAVRRDGDTRYIAVRLHVIKDAAGQPVKCYGVNQDTTGHRKMLESLQIARDQLAIAMDLAKMACWEYDIAADRFLFNDQVYLLFDTTSVKEGGYSMSAAEYADRFVHPDDMNLMANEIAAARASGNPHYSRRFEHRIIRRDGEPRYISTRISMIQNAEGRPDKLYGTIQDITESRQAEEEIKRSMSLLRGTLESTADGILVVDSEGHISGFNSRFVRLWGIPQSVMDSKDDRSAIQFVLDQLNEPERFLAKIQQLYAQPEAEDFDTLEFKDGRTLERYSMPQWIDGKPVGRVWSFRDVTAQKRSQEELRQREASLASIFLAAPVGIGVVKQRIILQVNQRFSEMVGYTADELIGQSARLLYPTDEEYERVGREKYQQMEEHGTGTVETRWRHKDGHIINILLSSTPLYNADPRSEVTFTALDITERKQAEEALKLEHDLARRVAETSPAGVTALNREGQIIFANRMAERVLGLKKDRITSLTYNAPDWRITDFEGNPFPDEQLPFQRVKSTQKPVYDLRHAIEHPDGSRVLLSIDAAPFFTEGGDFDGVVAVLQDLTTSNQADTLLHILRGGKVVK